MRRSTWRDEHGKRLTDYPRPSVAVDVAVLSVAPGSTELGVLLHRRDASDGYGDWSLPGTFIHERETLMAAALRALDTKLSIRGLHPRQLEVFDDPNRDPRGWVISVAHVDAVPHRRLVDVLADRDDVILAPVSSPPGKLPYDHQRIIESAVTDLRELYRHEPDPADLLGRRGFTLLELRRLHEAVAGRRLQKDTFRRQMIDHLDEAGLEPPGRVGRPAAAFKKKLKSTRRVR